jgi:hypothetical protein
MTLGELGSSLGRTAARPQNDDKADIRRDTGRQRSFSVQKYFDWSSVGRLLAGENDRLEHC